MTTESTTPADRRIAANSRAPSNPGRVAECGSMRAGAAKRRPLSFQGVASIPPHLLRSPQKCTSVRSNAVWRIRRQIPLARAVPPSDDTLNPGSTTRRRPQQRRNAP
jgi:hypothetical protein